MKSRFLVFALAFAVLGCGKTAEQKKLEADLNAEIQKVHAKQMSSMKVLDSLLASLDATVARHDSLAKRWPKEVAGHSTDDITAARAGIAGAKAAMDSWMKGYKPYDPELPHEQAMAALNKDMQSLMGLQTEIDGAMSGAASTVTAHAKAAEELMAKMVKKK